MAMGAPKDGAKVFVRPDYEKIDDYITLLL
jgi:hypothetical protein